MWGSYIQFRILSTVKRIKMGTANCQMVCDTDLTQTCHLTQDLSLLSDTRD